MPPLLCRRPVLAVLAGAAVLLLAGDARADLLDYVKKPEPKFAWKLLDKTEGPELTIYDLSVTSQTWEGINWEHRLQVFLPKGVKPGDAMLLYNTGGGPSLGTVGFGTALAERIKAPTAILYDIPNQPLLEGKLKEDALIAETFVRTLKTRDFDWPLLFPMVKSVLKSLDALQEFGKQEWKTDVKRFVVCGASKRGWTSWLTGAVQDPRVVAIAPMVIDTLNMQDQLAYQKKSFGAYSEMIHDYTERGLIPLPPGDDARKLWNLVDPYFYRKQLTLPKLLINGNNDPYWTVDALNLYWDDLSGPKYVTYVPNAGHDLKQRDVPAQDERARAVNALSAFARAQVANKPLPKLSWKHDDAEGRLRLVVDASPAPKAARVWVATAATHDFRKSTWKEQAAKVDKGTVTGLVAPPAEGCLAFWCELDYEVDGLPYTLGTQIRVAEAKKE